MPCTHHKNHSFIHSFLSHWGKTPLAHCVKTNKTSFFLSCLLEGRKGAGGSRLPLHLLLSTPPPFLSHFPRPPQRWSNKRKKTKNLRPTTTTSHCLSPFATTKTKNDKRAPPLRSAFMNYVSYISEFPKKKKKVLTKKSQSSDPQKTIRSFISRVSPPRSFT